MAMPVILRDLLSLPTASFVEKAVLNYLRDACRGLRGVSARSDRYGNLLAHYRYRPRAVTPIAFSAHTDHPGFVADRMIDAKTLLAKFRGGVFAEYFPQTRVRFWSGGRWINGRVEALTKTKEVYRLIGKMRLPEEARIRVREPVEPNAPGMWDLPDPALKGDRVHARGCDDVAGCAAMLALLQRLSKKRARADVYCLFTRAEEVGFVGAIAAARNGTLSKKTPIVAIETSSARAGALIGGGPVLRVGDKASTFTPQLNAYCARIARALAKRRKSFTFQRKLMDGGTCESTAFAAYGYTVTGICLALGNYHNMDIDRKRIATEYVSLKDWKQMVDWFEALALDEQGYGRDNDLLREEMETRFAEWRPLIEGGHCS